MSRISHKYKFIYLAYPKTASTSIRDLLDPHSDVIAGKFTDRTEDNPFYNHITAAETKELFLKRGWDYDSYFKFVVIRNPWARIVSLYNMSDCKRMSFIDWIKSTKQSVQRNPHTRPVEKWKSNGVLSLLNFAGDGKKLLVDRVIRLEDIDTEMPLIFEQLGLPKLSSIPVKNIGTYHLPSFGRDWRKYYTNNEAKACVKEMFGWEMKEYKYSFY